MACNAGHWILSTAIETRLLQSQEELHPEDSISNTAFRACSKSSCCSRKGLLIGCHASSHASSISAARTKAATKRAVLQAEAVSLERFQALQEEELTNPATKRSFGTPNKNWKGLSQGVDLCRIRQIMWQLLDLLIQLPTGLHTPKAQ